MGELDTLTFNALAAMLWPFFRLSGFFMNLLVFSGRSMPMRVRLMLALSCTVCILPMVPAVDPHLQLMSTAGVLITIREVLIGVAIGYLTQFLSQVFTIAGQVVAMQTGLGFASLVDPVSGTNSPVVGQFLSVLTTLVFLAMNGHLLFLRMMVMSFETLPIGGGFLTSEGIHEMVLLLGAIFLSGLAVSISAVCTMLVVNFTLGVMTRAAPQLNVFSLGFAITMVTGLVVLSLIFRAYLSNYTHSFNELIEVGCTLLTTSCEGFLQ